MRLNGIGLIAVAIIPGLPACGSSQAPSAVTNTVTVTAPSPAPVSSASTTQATTPAQTAAAGTTFPSGTYLVPQELPRGIYTAANLPGEYPGCIWATYTRDGTVIDLFNQTLNTDATFTIEVLSPAVAKFHSSKGCTSMTLNP